MNLETLCVHAGHAPDPTTGAVAPPIHLSTTFERDVDGEFRRGFKYARDLNPTRQALETALAAIEGGAAALAFASGQAATSAVFQALRPGDHVVLPESVYYGTPRLAQEVFGPWGLRHTAVDMRDADAVAATLRPETRIVWIETPSNPLLAITDVARIAALARDAGARVVVDNTWATPVGQQPLSLGADLVMHASTKYLGGHSDVMGGALIAREDDAFFARIRLVQQAGGAIAGPFDSWLVLRGLRTLPWRVRAHSANAQAVASFLAGHPRVEAVHYPGLPSHPGAEVVRRQMRLPGGMASLQIRGSADDAMATVARLRLFTRATSLGGTESLVEHRASIEGPTSRTPPNLLRLSIGLEHPDDLIADLEGALG
ncbi:MAG TPA: aminotransferase class I/II-fold pyridoxal phosphate-dependent enzyme [Gemmatimonadaceae bacterium]|nr:aminotransferase class I/II-fold pyridoxal phosphate-dependent enzyme [Gemmatimonadaceae bacterium]